VQGQRRIEALKKMRPPCHECIFLPQTLKMLVKMELSKYTKSCYKIDHATSAISPMKNFKMKISELTHEYNTRFNNIVPKKSQGPSTLFVLQGANLGIWNTKVTNLLR